MQTKRQKNKQRNLQSEEKENTSDPDMARMLELWDWEFKTTVTNIGEVNGTPLQYSCLENPIDGGAW